MSIKIILSKNFERCWNLLAKLVFVSVQIVLNNNVAPMITLQYEEIVKIKSVGETFLLTVSLRLPQPWISHPSLCCLCLWDLSWKIVLTSRFSNSSRCSRLPTYLLYNQNTLSSLINFYKCTYWQTRESPNTPHTHVNLWWMLWHVDSNPLRTEKLMLHLPTVLVAKCSYLHSFLEIDFDLKKLLHHPLCQCEDTKTWPPCCNSELLWKASGL